MFIGEDGRLARGSEAIGALFKDFLADPAMKLRYTPGKGYIYSDNSFIVLGEVVVGSVNGMADLTPLDLDESIIGLCGVLVAIGLWDLRENWGNIVG